MRSKGVSAHEDTMRFCQSGSVENRESEMGYVTLFDGRLEFNHG